MEDWMRTVKGRISTFFCAARCYTHTPENKVQTSRWWMFLPSWRTDRDGTLMGLGGSISPFADRSGVIVASQGRTDWYSWRVEATPRRCPLRSASAASHDRLNSFHQPLSQSQGQSFNIHHNTSSCVSNLDQETGVSFVIFLAYASVIIDNLLLIHDATQVSIELIERQPIK